MKLSDSDLKFVRRLKKNGRAWRWVRWFTLFGSVGLVVQCAFLIMDLLKQNAEVRDKLGVISLIAPLCWILLGLSSVLLGYTLAFWGGDPRTRLLLRLFEDHEADS